VEVPRRFAGILAKAAGFGTLAGLVVCCVLPVGAAALVGAAAAPLASLDQPGVIAGVALVFAAAAFAWQTRRHARAPESDPAGSSCGSGC
jgi:hypothetical protein